ncbi:MAG: Vacuolar morphogenesis protein 6 [Phylliscum demangeonii]|nr:MAG: Vacuolar morphogenesis protein 6 [Phylliscum demangeonii]
MLSAFAARPLIELKQRDKSKIESVLVYGNKLLLGLNTGSLRVYRINESEDDHRPERTRKASQPPKVSGDAPRSPIVELLRDIEKFSRRAVEQLAVIKEANLLVSLSDGYISFHDLQSPQYEVQEQLLKTKGASVFSVASNIVKDQSTGVPSIVSQLAVAVKRKLLVWSWQDTEISSSTTELALPAAIRTLTWVTGGKILCGLHSGYVLVDVLEQSMLDIGEPGHGGASVGHDEGRLGAIGAAGMGYVGMGNWGPKPLATQLTGGEILLAKDMNTLFINSEGKPLDRRQIQWSTAPEAISFSYPYLLALHGASKGALEIRNPTTQSLLQTIQLPNAVKLHVPQPSVSLAHAGKGFLVASTRGVWRMKAESYEHQIDQLLEGVHFDEAISLLDMLEDALLDDKESRLQEVKLQKAEQLFRNRKYRASLDLFTEVEAPPERVIRLYPAVVSGSLAIESHGRESEASCDREGLADGSTERLAGKRVSKVEGLKNDAVQENARSEAKTQTMDPPRSSFDKADGASSVDGNSLLGNYAGSAQSPGTLEGKDLPNAIRELYAFLADTRRRIQNYLGTDGCLKETSQDKAQVKKTVMRTFVARLDKATDLDPEVVLRDAARLVDTTLFRAYLVERPARARSLFRIPNFCDPDVVNERLLQTGRYEDLVDFFYGKNLHRQALELLARFMQVDETEDVPSALRGPEKTMAYLQGLSAKHIDLILEFVERPLLSDPKLGMEVFLADTENAETLPRGRVLEFLQGLSPRFAFWYLEHIIQELNDTSPEYHQQLVNLYLTRLKEQNASGDADAWPFNSSAERTQWTEKMQSFLASSSSRYSTGKTFSLLPKDDPEFYEARAIILGKMGNHKQALEIYVFKIGDYTKAEVYIL